MRLTRLVVFALAVTAVPAGAQGRFPPDSLVNVKFFPKTTPVRQVIDQMRGFTFALGVRCQYCHVGQEGMPLDSFNFQSDDKRTKLTARVMLEMVRSINTQHLSQVPERPTPNVEVTCMTCHRGVSRPRALDDIVMETVQQVGPDSAVKAYRALRDRYYGRSAYDFGENTLGNVGDALNQQRRFDDALVIERLNLEFFPNSGMAYGRIGESYRMKGDTANAVANYRLALTKDPNAPVARRRLREMGQGPN